MGTHTLSVLASLAAAGGLTLACGGSPSASSSDGEAVSTPAAPSGTYARREAIHLYTDGSGFDLTPLDPKTGAIQAAHPTKYVVTGTAVWTTKDFATGEKDRQCGTVDSSTDSVDFTGTCGLASDYDRQEDGSFERREQIDLTQGGFTRTMLDPKTGQIEGAHPEKFVVEGAVVWTTKNFATGEKDQQCGGIKVNADSIEFSGQCDLWDFYDKQ
jgi:hypothetical protein